MFDDKPGAGRLAHAGDDHPPAPQRRIGVLLSNLGTPTGTGYWSMRRYLSQFLSDQRVIDYPKWKWQPILQAIILTKRPFSSGEAYRGIWNNELDESPLLTTTRAQTEKARDALSARHGDALMVEFGMRYGEPSIGDAIARMQKAGCDRILLFPLYPQYSATTTATACDAAFDQLKTMPWQPALRVAPHYADHPRYIEALARSVRDAYAAMDHRPDALVTSYHGLPVRYLTQGDPYHCLCQKTTRLMRDALGFSEEEVVVAFQSRFGPEEWLKPYCVEKVAALARAGKKHIAVMAPAFSADCVETLEEINEEIKEAFEHAGGERFDYIPCLNDDADHIDMIVEIVETELKGWL